MPKTVSLAIVNALIAEAFPSEKGSDTSTYEIGCRDTLESIVLSLHSNGVSVDILLASVTETIDAIGNHQD